MDKYSVKLYREDKGYYFLSHFDTLEEAVHFVAVKNGCSDLAWAKFYGGAVTIFRPNETEPYTVGSILRPGTYVFEVYEEDDDRNITKNSKLYSSVDRIFVDFADYANKEQFTIRNKTHIAFGLQIPFTADGILKALAFAQENDDCTVWVVDSVEKKPSADGNFSDMLPPLPFHTNLVVRRRLVL